MHPELLCGETLGGKERTVRKFIFLTVIVNILYFYFEKLKNSSVIAASK
jgi:hypothetical protein